MSRHIEPVAPNPLDQIPGGLFILTAEHDGKRDAVLVKWVQQCSDHPPMVMVALPKGLAIELLIRETHGFALCQISADDRFLIRKFTHRHEHGEDPLVTMMTRTAPSGAPMIDRAMTCLDCEIVRHVELDSDYRIYVGQVHYSAVLNHGTPAVCFGGNGLSKANGT